MSSKGPALTRGPLPASVYWRRRAAVLGMLLLLVIGVTRMFGGGGGDADATARTTSASTSTTTHAPVVPDGIGAVDSSAPAAPVSSVPQSPAPDPSPSVTPTPVAPTTPATTLPQPSAVLPTPTGRCSDDDVNVAAAVGTAEATHRVAFALTIHTNVQAACLWQLGPKAVQLQVTSGSDRIWSTLDCPAAVPSRELTLRRDTPVQVTVHWDSRRSDSTCSDHTQWALPGYYHVQVAALGGEPTDIQFRLTKPVPAPPKPTTTATPTAGATAPAAGAPASKGATVRKNPKKKGIRSEPTGTPVVAD